MEFTMQDVITAIASLQERQLGFVQAAVSLRVGAYAFAPDVRSAIDAFGH